MSKKIAVIGGGAAGMMAAIQAAYAGSQVTIYEKNERIGKKILSTGNGKCNFSNKVMNAECYYGSGVNRVERIYDLFGVEETKDFFRKLGMRIKDKNGYLYPASEQAATVLDVLRYEIEHLKIRCCMGCMVTGINRVTETGNGMREGSKDPGSGKTLHQLVVETDAAGYGRQKYDAVILACGGRAAPRTGSDGYGFVLAERLGHRIVPTVPALTALRCGESFLKQVAGVRCEAQLTLYIDGDAFCTVHGELQMTDYGISGIPVFQFSRTAAYALRENKNVTVNIDFMPDSGVRNETFWVRRWERQKEQSMEQFVTGIVNKKVGLLLLKLAGIKETETAGEIITLRRKKLETLFHSLKVTVKETNSFEQAQVCAGGVDFGEVTENLQSVKASGLFFAGEMLDIDGICGGYNLQWAWSSGAVAGASAAGRTEPVSDVHADRPAERRQEEDAAGDVAQKNAAEITEVLTDHLDRLHTTELGGIRIRKNLALDTADVVAWCRTKIASEQAVITRQGKNWYIEADNCIITVNAYSYTIITAHKKAHIPLRER